MKIRGNNLLFFGVELCAGISVFIFTLLWGDIGLLGLILFFSGLILVRSKSIPDERETDLIFKATSLEVVFLGGIKRERPLSFNTGHLMDQILQ